LHPEVVDQLRRSCDQWWGAVLPFMVNESLPQVEEHQLAARDESKL